MHIMLGAFCARAHAYTHVQHFSFLFMYLTLFIHLICLHHFSLQAIFNADEGMHKDF